MVVVRCRGSTGGTDAVKLKRSMLAPYHATRRRVAFVVTCAQCREEVLEADVIGDEEECLLRDHLLAIHPTTVQPHARGVAQALRRDRGGAAGSVVVHATLAALTSVA